MKDKERYRTTSRRDDTFFRQKDLGLISKCLEMPEEQKRKIPDQPTIGHYLFVAIGLGLFFWVFEALVHTFVFFHGNLLVEIFTPTLHEIWMRALVIFLFIIFGIYARFTLIKQRQAELALWESEEKFRLLAETIQDVFWLTTPGTTQMVYVSPAYEKIWGRPQDSLYKSPQSFLETIHHEDRERVFHKIRAHGKASPWDVEYRIIRPDGSIRWIQDRRFPVHDKNGTLSKIAGIAIDITQRKKSEEELHKYHYQLEEIVKERTFQLTEMNKQLQQEVEEREHAEQAIKLAYLELNQIFNAAADGMCVIDNNFKVLRINETFCTLLDVSKEGAIGKSCYDLFHSYLCRTSLCPLLKFRSGAECFECDYEFARSDDTKISCILTTYPFRGCNGELLGIVESFKDVTERKKAQEELQKRNKLDSISTLAAGIAHDLNNFLAAIIGNLSLLELYLKNGGNTFEVLKGAKKACYQTKELTQQLLTFSQGGEPVKKVVDISDLIVDTGNLVLRGTNVRYELSVSDNLWPVEIDTGQITQVIHNLMINARHAMPDGGIIKIYAQNAVVGRNSNLPLKEGNYIKISVEDQGIGIPKEHIQKIFDPYFTTKKHGSGLGLATTYSIIKKHQGYITLESTPGIGTTFHMYLPVSEREANIREDEAERQPLHGEGKILIMDDQLGIRDMVGQMLDYLGYKVIFACDGMEAVEIYKLARESGQGFDAVILDLAVPGGIGGKDAIQRLLSADPQAKVIVSSSYANNRILSEYKKYGFHGVVTKPFEIQELSEVLYKVIHG